MLRRFLALVLVACVLVPRAAPAISVGEEKKLGRRFALEAAGQLPISRDPAVVELVRACGQRLVGTLGPQAFDYRFQVVRAPVLNAFAVPGGYVYVFSGLVARVASVDELASVIGHEIAHVHAHHIARQQERTQLWNYAGLVGLLLSAVQPALGAVALGAALTAQLKYTREFEQEADYLGLRFMHEGGYAATAMPVFFKKILAEQRLNPAGVPPYLLTHPLTEDRIANVETALAAFPRSAPTRAAGPDRALEEARAVARAEAEPADVVLAEYRGRAEAAPQDGFAQYLLGSVYVVLGRFDAARDALERARALGGAGPRLPMRLARVYLGQERAAEARDLAAGYVTAHPEDADARAVLGRILLELGEERRAIAELERSLSLDPLADEPHRLLGQVYGRSGRTGDGYYHLAVAFELRGELEQALSQYVRARDVLGESAPRAAVIKASIAEIEEIVGARRRARGRR